MSSLVLDTNIVSYLMRGHSLAAPGSNTLCISFMTVAEMFEGAKRAGWGAAKWARLNSILLSYVVIPSSPNLIIFPKISAGAVNLFQLMADIDPLFRSKILDAALLPEAVFRLLHMHILATNQSLDQ